MIVNENEIKQLITAEAERGLELYGKNHSRHEGYAVAKEEFEEFEEEYDAVVGSWIQIWKMIRADMDKDVMLAQIKNIKECAVHMIGEAIQFAAMLEKMERFEKGE